MEELFEFDLSDVAAFESVVTPAAEPQPIEAPRQETEEQISTQNNQHEPTQEPSTGDPLQPPQTLQQQQSVRIQLQQHHQLATPGQQSCKILLIPIKPGLKNLIQLPQGASPLLVNALKPASTVNNTDHSINIGTNKIHHKLQLPSPQPPKQSQPMTPGPNEVPKRKPCNCTKSQCLKLYCDCFANGEFCSGCNCKDCYNSLSKEKERQKAITQCLERNPEAFRPKIGKAIKGTTLGEPAPESIERRHTKGCNCKRSGCLKNYCECYEAKILCSNLCKCCGCKNYEESYERKTSMQLANSSADTARGILRGLLPVNSLSSHQDAANINRQGKNFINKEVIQASLVCLLQSAQQAEKDEIPSDEVRNLIHAEMGRCLRMIANESIQNSSFKLRHANT